MNETFGCEKIPNLGSAKYKHCRESNVKKRYLIDLNKWKIDF